MTSQSLLTVQSHLLFLVHHIIIERLFLYDFTVLSVTGKYHFVKDNSDSLTDNWTSYSWPVGMPYYISTLPVTSKHTSLNLHWVADARANTCYSKNFALIRIKNCMQYAK